MAVWIIRNIFCCCHRFYFRRKRGFTAVRTETCSSWYEQQGLCFSYGIANV